MDSSFSDFSIDAILGLKSSKKPNSEAATSCCSCSPRSSPSSSDSESEADSFRIYFKSVALHQIQLARLQLLPPAWSQRQQKCKQTADVNKSRKYEKIQTDFLLQKYQEKPYVTREEMIQLSNRTGLTSQQVKIWFQNRRLKDRKMLSLH